jgi:signal transduction histidine kinase
LRPRPRPAARGEAAHELGANVDRRAGARADAGMWKPSWSISIRARILLFQVIVAAAVLVMAGVVYVAIRSADYYVNRTAWTNQQLRAISELAVAANRYSEQIAEMLLIGPPERADFQSARAALEASFAKLEQLSREEIAFLQAPEERAREQRELDRLRRMRALYDDINRSAEQLFALRDAGRQDEAVVLFRREIENRLDAEFENLIGAAVEDEVAEVESADREAAEMARRLMVLLAVSSLMAIVASVVTGYLLHRSLAQPIAQLTRGAIAIGQGDLEHRIGYSGKDELGLLAMRFDDMAGRIRDQQGQLLAARSHLEEQVRQRTEALEEANRRLREVDHLRIQFLADISHELRTPLTVLRGEAEVTLRGNSRPETGYRETLVRIVDQAEDMARLVDDLLFLARAETDTIQFERIRLDLRDVLVEAVFDAEVLSAAKPVTIESSTCSAPLMVDGDRQRLKQALMIVLDNAVKYSEVGGVVTVDLRTGASRAELVVRNCGTGIAPEDRPYVFDRFYRGRGTSAKEAAGSGLGLPIAKWMIEKHGGSIGLTSAEGVTEVRIGLPVVA